MPPPPSSGRHRFYFCADLFLFVPHFSEKKAGMHLPKDSSGEGTNEGEKGTDVSRTSTTTTTTTLRGVLNASFFLLQGAWLTVWSQQRQKVSNYGIGAQDIFEAEPLLPERREKNKESKKQINSQTQQTISK